jgi:hypothetical protein
VTNRGCRAPTRTAATPDGPSRRWKIRRTPHGSHRCRWPGFEVGAWREADRQANSETLRRFSPTAAGPADERERKTRARTAAEANAPASRAVIGPPQSLGMCTRRRNDAGRAKRETRNAAGAEQHVRDVASGAWAVTAKTDEFMVGAGRPEFTATFATRPAFFAAMREGATGASAARVIVGAPRTVRRRQRLRSRASGTLWPHPYPTPYRSPPAKAFLPFPNLTGHCRAVCTPSRIHAR